MEKVPAFGTLVKIMEKMTDFGTLVKIKEKVPASEHW
jgi:hypothetical protein